MAGPTQTVLPQKTQQQKPQTSKAVPLPSVVPPDPKQFVNSRKMSEMEHADRVAPKLQESFRHAITTKNPLSLGTFQERGASIAAKLDRLRQDPDYLKLPDEGKAKVRGAIYDQFVPKSYENFSMPVPDKATWVKYSEKDVLKLGNRNDANSFYDDGQTQFAMNIFGGADKSLTNMSIFGLRVANKILLQGHGIDHIFAKHMPEAYGQAIEKQDKYEETATRRLINTQKEHTQSSDFWLKNHYRDSWFNTLGSISGDVIASWPLYAGVGEGLNILGRAAGFEATAVGLTPRLLAGPKGRFVYNNLKAATDGYVSGFISGGGDANSGIQGAESALGFRALGRVAGFAGKLGAKAVGAGEVKIPSYSSIKEWTAHLLGQGGQPFVQGLTISAAHETAGAADHFKMLDGQAPKLLNAPKASIALSSGDSKLPKILGGGNLVINPATSTTGFIEFEDQHYPYNSQQEQQSIFSKFEKKASQIHLDMGNGVIVKAQTETTGHISFQGHELPYTNAQERQEIYTAIEGRVRTARSVNDPLNHDLHKAEAHTLNSISNQMYKGKNFQELTPSARERVIAQRLKLINEAANEAGFHLKKEAAASINTNLEAQAKHDPEFANYMEQIKQASGQDHGTTIAEHNANKIAVETGIKDSKITLGKVNTSDPIPAPSAPRKANAVKNPSDPGYEPPNNATAFLRYRNDVVYSTKFTGSNRIAADGTKVGLRDKRKWNDILKSDNRAAFIDELKQVDGGMIKFENDLHRMLFHYSNRDALDNPVREKLLREIIKLKPKKLKGEWGAAVIAKHADGTAAHLYELAKSGRLISEKKMFGSTKPGLPAMSGDDLNWTSTQFKLAQKNDAAQFERITKALQRHPEQLEAVTAVVKQLEKFKYTAPDLKSYLEFENSLKSIERNFNTETIGR